MSQPTHFDTLIIGGGLAGLSAAILLAREGYRVGVFEKDSYPRHKVCGEYISMESYPFLRSLGLPLDEWGLPRIDQLLLTAPGGRKFETRLPLGGFGISRYLLDQQLAAAARSAGADLHEHSLVEDYQREAEGFSIQLRTTAGKKTIYARTLAGAWGKRSNIDLRNKRAFTKGRDRALNNWVGIKYHVHTNWPADTIGLHNFRNGYCGVSRIEEEKYCLCYLVRAEELRQCKGAIPELEEKILGRNRHLASLLRDAKRIEGFPVTISQVSFATKQPVEGGVLMLGDAAGMITPLCGNGMSIALHTGKIAAGLIHTCLREGADRAALEAQYAAAWKAEFASRLRTGRWLQRFFGAETASDLFLRTIATFPALARPLIRMTHGKEF